MTRALLILAALTLGGCATNRQVTLPPVTAKIPQSLKMACAGVVSIPERDLTIAEISHLWASDRTRLLSCLRRHAALAKAVSIIEAGK